MTCYICDIPLTRKKPGYNGERIHIWNANICPSYRGTIVLEKPNEQERKRIKQERKTINQDNNYNIIICLI